MSWDLSKYQEDADFWMHYSLADFRKEAALALEAAPELDSSVLAQRLQLSEAKVARLLEGSPTMTLETLGRLAGALGKRVEIRLVEREPLAPKTGPAAAGGCLVGASRQGRATVVNSRCAATDSDSYVFGKTMDSAKAFGQRKPRLENEPVWSRGREHPI